MRAALFLFALLVLASSCQTSRAVSFAYHDATYGGDTYRASDSTSVLFLIDGLSSDMLRTALASGNATSISDAFSLSTKGRFSLGRAVFPSLTFANISSILSGKPDQPITGNRMLVDGKVVNFENVVNWQDLALALQRKTIFYRLAADSQTSVSYSYAFSGGATAFQWTSAAAATSYLENDYASIDTQTLVSLRALLTETAPAKWPRFIFVHLIGVDATAHSYGPQDERVQAYIRALDAQLAPVFALLNHPNGKAFTTHPVNYALTADHGFRTTPDHSPLEDVVSHMNRRLRVVSDNRVAPLWSDEALDDSGRVQLAQALLQVPHVGWAAVRTEEGVELLRRTGDHARITIAHTVCPTGERAARFEWLNRASEVGDSLRIRERKVTSADPGPRDSIGEAIAALAQGSAHAHTEAPRSRAPASVNPVRTIAQLAAAKESSNVFTCLSDFDLATSNDDDSYIVPALVDYFAIPNAPDMVFIPDDHSDFASGYAGNHGGLSRDEMLVPVLTKDVDITRGVHPTYELLKIMGVEK